MLKSGSIEQVRGGITVAIVEAFSGTSGTQSLTPFSYGENMGDVQKVPTDDHDTGGTLSSDMEYEDVLADAEPWEPIETKLVLYSFAFAIVILFIGLFLVPTSIVH